MWVPNDIMIANLNLHVQALIVWLCINFNEML